jgi:exopolyphosphatase/guanosine-5'-triphosphate,3'-diphosphate pyrophosphatase
VDRPASADQVRAARDHVADLFAAIELPTGGSHIGVAGTWTSLAAIALDLPRYDPDRVHGSIVTSHQVTALVERLASLDLEQTAAIPSLDPKRAPVILAGAVVAEAVAASLRVQRTQISERDTLDGAAAELLALA